MSDFPKQLKTWALLLALLPLLSACGAFNLFSVTKASPDTLTLAGSAWVFISFNGPGGEAQPALPGSQLTVAFSPRNQVSGFAGCNEFAGRYSVSGGALAILHVDAGDAKCAPAVMEQEAAFLEALQQADRFEVRPLTLNLAHGANAFLHFSAPELAPGDPLAGSTWALGHFYRPSLGQRGLLDGTRITLMFGPGGTIDGFGGCNSYAGRYRIEGERILFDGVTSTHNPCDINAQQQEDEYLDALQRSQAFTLAGTALAVEYTFGRELQYALQR